MTALSESGVAGNSVWVPGWYNLDQSLAVGKADEYWFHASEPNWDDDAPAAVRGGEPVFFNGLFAPGGATVRMVRVDAIHHAQLGQLTSIRTERFGVYEFVDIAGHEFEVEAEQGPGVCYDPEVRIADWSVRVAFSDVATDAPNPPGFQLHC